MLQWDGSLWDPSRNMWPEWYTRDPRLTWRHCIESTYLLWVGSLDFTDTSAYNRSFQCREATYPPRQKMPLLRGFGCLKLTSPPGTECLLLLFFIGAFQTRSTHIKIHNGVFTYKSRVLNSPLVDTWIMLVAGRQISPRRFLLRPEFLVVIFTSQVQEPVLPPSPGWSKHNISIWATDIIQVKSDIVINTLPFG